MTHTLFIDGGAGTTGLEIAGRMAGRGEFELLTLDDARRKDPAARREALNEADFVILCLHDDAAREAVGMIDSNRVRVIDASTAHRVAFYEEYAKADAPDKVNHFGEELLGPTLIAFGTPEQQQRFLPRILDVTELWCQGYSEPGAGSDLANVSTTAELDGDQWVINGQKVWTSLAHLSQWCFVVARTEKGSKRHAGLSYLLVPLDQPGVEVRPIVQITGTAEFNEVFFDDARTDANLVVGEPGDGWRVAMGTLTFERGVSTLGQQIVYARELSNLAELAQRTGAADDPFIRERLTRAWTGLRAMRSYALATMDVEQPGQDNVSKLLWANWHRSLGELAMDVIGKPGMTLADGEFDEWQRLYLFTRADTIYGGSNEVQRNIVAQTVLG